MIRAKAFLFLASIVGAAEAGTFHVDASNPNCPGDGSAANPFCRIQPAMIAAANGDTVLVQPGVYVEHIEFLGKSIRLESALGPAVTAIRPDPQSNLSAVRFVNGEGDGAWIIGFEIGSTLGTPSQVPIGDSTAGGAIFARDASPRIVGNWFKSPTSVAAGGAIACIEGAPRIHSNTIEADFTAIHGAGIYLEGCSFVEIFDNVVDTFSAVDGGGLYVSGCNAPRFERNLVHGNVATHSGGGLLLAGGLAVMQDNVFHGNQAGGGGGVAVRSLIGLQCLRETYTDNVATGNGGGLWREGTGQLLVSRSHFENCTARFGGGMRATGAGLVTVRETEFVANHSTEIGCGAYLNAGIFAPKVERCLFRDHDCSDFLGIASGALMTYGFVDDCIFHDNHRALVPVGGPTSIDRSTFTRNTVAIDGWWNSSAIRATSSIFWDNGDATLTYHGLSGPEGKIVAEYSDLVGGYPGIGNITADPRFVAPQLNDYRLLPTSPCIEKGSPFNDSCVPDSDDIDFGGHPRQVSATFASVAFVDQGAHEFNNVTLAIGAAPSGFVNLESTGTAGLVTMLLIGFGEGDVCAPPYGAFLFNVDLAWFRVDWATLPSQVLVPIPAGLPPASVKLQQIALGPNGGANLSNAVTVVLD